MLKEFLETIKLNAEISLDVTRRKLNNEYCLRGKACSAKEAYVVIFKLRNIYETVDNTCC